jgi:hypothetical protein
VNRVCEAFELVKEAEMERFGEKSYFYREMNGLLLADSDDDPGLVGDDVHGHGFEEPEEELGEEEDVGVLEDGMTREHPIGNTPQAQHPLT